MRELYELTIARKHIVSKPKLVMFTILSVALAVLVIVVMMGLMEGYREDIISSTVENNPHLTVEPKEDEKYVYLYKTVSSYLWDYPNVLAVSPRLKGQAAAKYKDKVRGISFVGAEPLLEDPLMEVSKDMTWGSYHDLIFRKYSAVVGTGLAKDLELKTGDSFYIIRRNVTIKVKPAGYIRTGTTSDQSLVYLPLSTAQDLLGEGDVVSEVGVRLTDIYQAPAITSDLNARTTYEAKSWMDKSRNILELLDTQNMMMYIFYGLIFVIAGFGVANTMIMMVTRRTKEIGILMAMGSSRWSIIKIFLIESLILAPPSALLGCILSYITAKLIEAYPIDVPSEVYMVSNMRVELTPEMFMYAGVFALLVNFFAGIYPAYKASRMDPVEAIGTA